MDIFQAERDAGLGDLLTNNSVAYFSCAEAVNPVKDEAIFHSLSDLYKRLHNLDIENKAIASVMDIDLYPCKSILVSVGWNKNDDVFDPYEIWKARHTPEHKPDNLGHDEKVIVGHMVKVWGIDAEGNTIAEDTTKEDLPKKFHLINSSVIYKRWSDKNMRASIAELIEKVESGEKFVSMECLFGGFDYALASDDGTNYIVQRNEETAFLTKHLRLYKGTGSYKNYKIGRLLRNIVFCGKGYVDKPANPESIIINDVSALDFSNAQFNKNIDFTGSGVLINYDNVEKQNMELEQLKVELATAQSKIAELESSNKELSDKMLNMITKAEYDALGEKLIVATAATEDLNKKLADMVSKDEFAKAQADLATEKENVEKLNKKIDELNTEKVIASRISKLTEGGVDKAVAEKTVNDFINLNDEQFVSIAELAIKAASNSKTVETTSNDKDDKAIAKVVESLDSTAKPDLAIPTTEASVEALAKVEKVQAQLVDFVTKSISNKKKGDK